MVIKYYYLKKSNIEYFIRHNDVNKNKLFLFWYITYVFKWYYINVYFQKCREIWNKITEFIGINDPNDFVETTLGDYEDEFIMVDVQENTSAIRDKY